MENLKYILEGLLSGMEETIELGDKITKASPKVESMKKLLKRIRSKNSLTLRTYYRFNDMHNNILEYGDIVLFVGESLKFRNKFGVVNRYLRSGNIEVLFDIKPDAPINFDKPFECFEKISCKQSDLYLVAKAADTKEFIKKL